jgi:hypothetical protein
MIKSHMAIMDELKSYASPKSKLTRMIKSGDLIQIRRGLYVDDRYTPLRSLAPVVYGPSYISFQSALAIWNLIPERVNVMICASFNKNKDKVYHTPLGEFRYLYLPNKVYPYGIQLEKLDGMGYLVASPEKALCDMVYKEPSLLDVDEMEAYLLENLRIERERLLQLDHDFISWIAPRYRRKSLITLAQWFDRQRRVSYGK